MALLFDIETDGLLEEVTQIYCLVIKDTEIGVTYRYNNQPSTPKDYGSIEAGLNHLMDDESDILVAHNGIKFDIAVIRKLYPWFHIDEARVVDTLVLSRVIFADLADIDNKLIKKGRLPNKLFRRHSLEAWGHRLGVHKADYTGGWEVWSQEMEDYCEQDVYVLEFLYEHLVRQQLDPQAHKLEHQVAWICAQQERYGFMFDVAAAGKLHSTLVGHKLRLEDQLRASFPPRYMRDGVVFTPKKDSPKMGYVTAAPMTKVKLTEFNPGSRDHISHWLKYTQGWRPTVFTPDGKPKVDESVLAKLPYPEAKLLAEYLMVIKRLGQVAEGDQAWLKQVGSDGRMHGGVITNGAVTGRATHSQPNMGQVPAVDKPYGVECRSLFCVPEGKVLVGADLSGLELRCLAHFMARYDGGAYAKLLLEGDIHTANQQAAGLPTRNNAKTFIYAFLYGAGDEKIGSIVGKGREAGRELKAKFLRGLPALGKLVAAVQAAAKRGYLVGLDGRNIPVRSSHAALNTLLQSAGALVAKQALVEFDLLVSQREHLRDVQQVAWIHDEIQIECNKEIADEVGQLAVQSFQRAGEHFAFRIPITGEYRVGNNWAETH